MINPALVLQKVIERSLRSLGYSVQKLPPPGYVPIDVLDLVVQEVYREKGALSFIEIGANDGKHVDPLFRYVRNPGWTGLLVEPHPVTFRKLEENYRGIPGMTLENAAITETDGSVKLFGFESDDLHAGMLASLNKGYVRFNGDGIKGTVKEFDVPSLSVKSLLQKHQITAFDLLQIDTEGYDYNILIQFLDAGVLPRIIHFENNFLTGKQRTHVAKRFIALGYRYLHIGIDTLAYRQEQSEAFASRMKGSKLA